jgi:hypothetical protein
VGVSTLDVDDRLGGFSGQVFSDFRACDQVESTTQIQRGGQVMADDAVGGDASLVARDVVTVHTDRVGAAVSPFGHPAADPAANVEHATGVSQPANIGTITVDEAADPAAGQW